MKDAIKIVENGIYIDKEALKKIIVNEWQSGNFYNHYYNQGFRGNELHSLVLSELDDYVDELIYETEEKAQKNFGQPNTNLDWFEKYPKSDFRSIGFEVADKLSEGLTNTPENLTTDDIPIILEFLDTPSDPESVLKAWEKWENYWANLDYPARRKKLLENGEE